MDNKNFVINIGIVVNILIGKDNRIDADDIGVVHTVRAQMKVSAHSADSLLSFHVTHVVWCGV